jgi:hypothetical protein
MAKHWMRESKMLAIVKLLFFSVITLKLTSGFSQNYQQLVVFAIGKASLPDKRPAVARQRRVSKQLG